MNTVFLGTSEFAARVLERLAASEHAPSLVLTRPDRPQGRGRRLAAPPVALCAERLGMPLSQPQSVNAPEVLEEVERAQPQAVVVCAFGALIKQPLLSRWPMLNVHPSLLPRWRGAAPIERAIIAGDQSTGVSIMRLTEGLDSGPICLAKQEPIGPDDDYGSLAQRLCRLGGELIVQALDCMQAGEPLRFAEQDEAGATYAEKIGRGDRLLDPSASAAELERLVRALHPHIGARLMLADGSMLGICRAAVAELAISTLAPTPSTTSAAQATSAPPTHGGRPAEGALATDGRRLLLGVADGALELLEVKPEGGRAMDAQAYMRGHAL